MSRWYCLVVTGNGEFIYLFVGRSPTPELAYKREAVLFLKYLYYQNTMADLKERIRNSPVLPGGVRRRALELTDQFGRK